MLSFTSVVAGSVFFVYAAAAQPPYVVVAHNFSNFGRIAFNSNVHPKLGKGLAGYRLLAGYLRAPVSPAD